MKWQDIGIFFKKVSKSRTIWVGAGVGSIISIFLGISLLTGITITSSGDMVCGEECITYVNITSTYWRICFNDTNFQPLYFNKQPIDYEVLVPTRGKDNWRPLKVGDCIERKNKYNVLPNRFKIIVEKNKWDSIKYGVNIMGEDLDPVFFGSNYIEVDGKVAYEKVCIPVYNDVKYENITTCHRTEMNTIFVNKTVWSLTMLNKTCVESQIINNKCNTSNIATVTQEANITVEYECNNYYIKKEIVDCIYTGEVIEIGVINKSHKVENYACGVDDIGIICDEKNDILGGTGDGDGNGICSEGETCIRQ